MNDSAQMEHRHLLRRKTAVLVIVGATLFWQVLVLSLYKRCRGPMPRLLDAAIYVVTIPTCILAPGLTYFDSEEARARRWEHYDGIRTKRFRADVLLALFGLVAAFGLLALARAASPFWAVGFLLLLQAGLAALMACGVLVHRLVLWE